MFKQKQEVILRTATHYMLAVTKLRAVQLLLAAKLRTGIEARKSSWAAIHVVLKTRK